jgi:hypothetical protein
MLQGTPGNRLQGVILVIKVTGNRGSNPRTERVRYRPPGRSRFSSGGTPAPGNIDPLLHLTLGLAPRFIGGSLRTLNEIESEVPSMFEEQRKTERRQQVGLVKKLVKCPENHRGALLPGLWAARTAAALSRTWPRGSGRARAPSTTSSGRAGVPTRRPSAGCPKRWASIRPTCSV